MFTISYVTWGDVRLTTEEYQTHEEALEQFYILMLTRMTSHLQLQEGKFEGIIHEDTCSCYRCRDSAA